jgi:hypothetical protein
MPGFGAILGRERSIMNRQHRLFEPRTASLAAAVGAAVISSGAKR